MNEWDKNDLYYKNLSKENPLVPKKRVTWERTEIISPIHGIDSSKTKEIQNSFKTDKIDRNVQNTQNFSSIEEFLNRKHTSIPRLRKQNIVKVEPKENIVKPNNVVKGLPEEAANIEAISSNSDVINDTISIEEFENNEIKEELSEDFSFFGKKNAK